MRQPFHHHPYHQCASMIPQSEAYGAGYYPEHDQNLYQYGQGYEYGNPSLDPNMAALPDSQPGYFTRWFDFSDPCYLKGFIIGAGITFLLTNSTVQRAIVRGAVNLVSCVQGGVEEIKEQIKDIKAEMSQKEE